MGLTRRRRTILRGMALATLATFLATWSVAGAQDPRTQLERNIRQQLLPLDGVFEHFAFKVDGKHSVTLLGQVRTPILKQQAEEAVKRVEGIQRVQNRIQVLPLRPTDDNLRQALFRAIYSQTGFERYAQQAVPPIHIIVSNGSVTLEGYVANSLELAQAKAAANNVPGVFSVRNNLHIDNGKSNSGS